MKTLQTTPDEAIEVEGQFTDDEPDGNALVINAHQSTKERYIENRWQWSSTEWSI